MNCYSSWVRSGLVVPLVAVGAAAWWLAAGSRAAEPAKNQDKPEPAPVFVQCVDGSYVKLVIRDDKLDIQTAYGKLAITVADIRRIELATRLRDETARRIESAVKKLGSPEFGVRDAAGVELLAYKEKGYPALVKAAKDPDPEVARRADELLAKIRATVSAVRLEVRTHDVVYTDDCKITGYLLPAALKVFSGAFGERQLRLADVRELNRREIGIETEAALPDPGNLSLYQDRVGKILSFQVTGGGLGGGWQNGQVIFNGGLAGGMVMRRNGAFMQANGSVWGTDVYTLDSTLALAAVHAGAVKMGETRVVKVKILGPQNSFASSTRHGVASAAFGPYPGSFQFVRER